MENWKSSLKSEDEGITVENIISKIDYKLEWG